MNPKEVKIKTMESFEKLIRTFIERDYGTDETTKTLAISSLERINEGLHNGLSNDDIISLIERECEFIKNIKRAEIDRG
jgi:hypothetical protein